MYRKLIVAPLAALLLSACVVAPADHGHGMVMVPAMPVIVELGAEPNGTTLIKSRDKPWR